MARFAQRVAAGESRHESAVPCVARAMREAAAGYYPAQLAADRLGAVFTEALNGDRDAAVEYAGILAWAVGQARAADVAQVRQRTEGRLGLVSQPRHLGRPGQVSRWTPTPCRGCWPS